MSYRDVFPALRRVPPTREGSGGRARGATHPVSQGSSVVSPCRGRLNRSDKPMLAMRRDGIQRWNGESSAAPPPGYGHAVRNPRSRSGRNARRTTGRFVRSADGPQPGGQTAHPGDGGQFTQWQRLGRSPWPSGKGAARTRLRTEGAPQALASAPRVRSWRSPWPSATPQSPAGRSRASCWAPSAAHGGSSRCSPRVGGCCRCRAGSRAAAAHPRRGCG